MMAMYELLSWRIVLYTTMLWVALGAIGCTVLFLWNDHIQEERRDEARNIAESVAHWMEAELFRLSVPLFTMSTLITRSRTMLDLAIPAQSYPLDPERPDWRIVPPHPAEIQDEFQGIADICLATMSGDIRSAVSYFEASPRGVISIVSGSNREAVGLNLMTYDPEENAIFSAIRANTLSAVGPVYLVENDALGIIVHLPLFVDASVEGSMDTRQMPKVQEEVVPGKNFWGFLSVVVNATELFAKSQATQRMSFHRLRFSFSHDGNYSASTDAAERNEILFYSSGDGMVGGESVHIHLPNQVWLLGVDWLDGTPDWLWPGFVGIAAGALLVSLLLSLLLLSARQNKALLYRIMPKSAIALLAEGKEVVHACDDATVFFSHLVGFSELSSRSSALEVVAMLNELYTEFDRIAVKHQCFKVDTIADAYMVVGGAPPDTAWSCPAPEGAARVARFALEAVNLIESKGVSGIRLRAGMASGPVVAAVLGTAMPKYSFFGDTVNTASRMESTGEAGRLQVTAATRGLLELSGEGLGLHARGAPVEVKGKGPMQTFWVTRPDVPLDVSSRRAARSPSGSPGPGRLGSGMTKFNSGPLPVEPPSAGAVVPLPSSDMMLPLGPGGVDDSTRSRSRTPAQLESHHLNGGGFGQGGQAGAQVESTLVLEGTHVVRTPSCRGARAGAAFQIV